MAVVKASEIDRRLAETSRLPPIILVFGPDHGLAAERARTLVDKLVSDDDPFSVIRLGGDEVGSDPGRLSDEARTVALFGGQRVVWVRDAGTRNLAPALEPLLETPPEAAFVVIEAGDLKPTSPMRKLVEKSDSGLAVPCYSDGARDIDRLIAEEAGHFGLQTSTEAREALHALLGSDRASSRSEIAKLCLYARGDDTIRLDHVEAVVGDSSALSLDEIGDAAFLGDAKASVQRLKRLEAAGTHPSVVAGSALRLAQLLHRMRAQVDQGVGPETVVDSAQPRIFFRRKPAIKSMLKSWSNARLIKAERLLHETVLATRRHPALAFDQVADALLIVAQMARARR